MEKKRKMSYKDKREIKVPKVENVSILKYFKLNDSNSTACKQLLAHKLGKKILFHGGKFRMLSEEDGYSLVGGITYTIKRRFYPDYQPPTGRSPRQFASSISLGERVHRQIHHIYTCDALGKCNCEKRTSSKRPNRLVRVAQSFLSGFDIKPVATEVSIASIRAQKCTKLDMIGERWSESENKMSVVISWKTGYCSDYNKNRDGLMLQPPLEKYESTPQHHNQIQSIIEYKIIEREYGIKFDEYIIVYLGHKGDDTFDFEYLREQDLFKEKADAIYQAFL